MSTGFCHTTVWSGLVTTHDWLQLQGFQLKLQQHYSCLNYITVGTHPDIAYAIDCLASFLNCYRLEHWEAAISAHHGFSKPAGYLGMGKLGMGQGLCSATHAWPIPTPQVWQVSCSHHSKRLSKFLSTTRTGYCIAVLSPVQQHPSTAAGDTSPCSSPLITDTPLTHISFLSPQYLEALPHSASTSPVLVLLASLAVPPKRPKTVHRQFAYVTCAVQ